MEATKWYQMIEQQQPGYIEQCFTNLVNRDCSHASDGIMADFFVHYAKSRGDDVFITDITWKELRQRRRWVSRRYTPKPKVSEQVNTPEPEMSDEPIQPDLNLSVSHSLNEALILALKDNTAAQRDLTSAAWAVERNLLPKFGDC